MSQNLPDGPGFCYQRKENGKFDFQSMLSNSNWSYESIRWLAYMETQPPFRTDSKQIRIRHVLNGGEQLVKVNGNEYLVDGYAKIDDVQYFLEYDGCRFHHHNCITSMRSTLLKKDDSKRNIDLKKAGVLLQIFECDWMKLKSSVSCENNVSDFFARKDIEATEIMDAIINDRFYGIIRVDIKSPGHVVDHFLKINHPPIFAHKHIEKEMIGASMQTLLNERKARFPLDKQLTLVFNHDQYVLTTDMAKFYLEKGMELSNLTLAIEYTRSTPLANFVNTVTEKRKEATRIGDQNLQNTWKLISNSSYGRMTLNLMKRNTYKYVKIKDAPTIDENVFLTNVHPVEGEYETGYVEVTCKKRRTVDKVPGNYYMNYIENKFYRVPHIRATLFNIENQEK